MMAPQIRGDATRRAFVNARLVDPAAGLDQQGGIVIADGRIVAAGPSVSAASAGGGVPVTDCRGRLLIPGLIDMRVFTGEPGNEHRETLASASAAAAAGGVTTMIVMPSTDPVIDDAALVDFILRRARDTAIVRVAPMAAITKGLNGVLMTEIGTLKEAGAVAVTDGRRAVTNARVFRRALAYAKDFGMLVVQHVEEPELATGVMNEGEVATRLGLPGIPTAAEVIMLERDLRLVELTGAPYHAAQISSAAALEVIRAAKARGLPVSCGVSISHLTLNEHDIGAYRTFYKLSPPLRAEEDRKALVEGVRDGTIDVIVSSHDPQDADTKRLPFAEAAFGASGLDTLLSAALILHHAGEVDLPRLVETMTAAPAALLGLESGRLTPGAPADFVIVDLDKSWQVRDEDLKTRSKNSPYEHRTLTGRAIETVVAGRSVWRSAGDAG
jgi:dihydroorotase